MLGSTVDTVHASTLAFRSISHIFYVAADSIPDCVSCPFGLNGEECPVDASGCSFAPRSSHLDHWMIFSMAWFFSRIFTAFFGLLFGVEALPIKDCGAVDIHTLIESSEQQQRQGSTGLCYPF